MPSGTITYAELRQAAIDAENRTLELTRRLNMMRDIVVRTGRRVFAIEEAMWKHPSLHDNEHKGRRVTFLARVAEDEEMEPEQIALETARSLRVIALLEARISSLTVMSEIDTLDLYERITKIAPIEIDAADYVLPDLSTKSLEQLMGLKIRDLDL